MFCIIILSIITLDYLIKHLLFNYFYKNKNFIINKNYPKLVYNYLNEIKLLSELEIPIKFYFFYHFIIYLILLIFFIFIYFL